MSVLVAQFQGRGGNQMMQWLFAYAYAQKHGFEFRSDVWVGQRLFQIDCLTPNLGQRELADLPRYNEAFLTKTVPQESFVFRGYGQTQECVSHYTKRQAQSWLRFRPEIETGCANAILADGAKDDRIVCHRRYGDFLGYNYPIVAIESYKRACEEFGLDWNSPGVSILTEEDPTPGAGFLPEDLEFAADLYRMIVAPTLLRANSSFSWIAGLLSNGIVLSPIIDGLVGGKEHVCRFSAGNHNRLADFDFTTSLYVSP